MSLLIYIFGLSYVDELLYSRNLWDRITEDDEGEGPEPENIIIWWSCLEMMDWSEVRKHRGVCSSRKGCMLSTCMRTMLGLTQSLGWTFWTKRTILLVSSLFTVVADVRRLPFWWVPPRSPGLEASDVETRTWLARNDLFCSSNGSSDKAWNCLVEHSESPFPTDIFW